MAASNREELVVEMKVSMDKAITSIQVLTKAIETSTSAVDKLAKRWESIGKSVESSNEKATKSTEKVTKATTDGIAAIETSKKKLDATDKQQEIARLAALKEQLKVFSYYTPCKYITYLPGVSLTYFLSAGLRSFLTAVTSLRVSLHNLAKS